MATYAFNPTDYQIPSGLNFQVAKDILSVVFERLRRYLTRTPTYEQLRDEIIRNAGATKFEIKLNNVLGKQDPKSSTGGAAAFLGRYFPGEDLATRQLNFSTLPSGFIAGVEDGVRLRFTTTQNHAIIAIVADNKSKGIAEQELYHLTMPREPNTFPDSRKHFTIHFTDENTGQHDYYRFDDLRTLVLSEGGGGSSTPAPPVQQPRIVLGPSPNPDDNFAARQSVFNLTDQQKAERRRTFRNWKLQSGRRRSTRRRPRRALRKTRKAYI